jgi:hypothetical protein
MCFKFKETDKNYQREHEEHMIFKEFCKKANDFSI